MPPVDPPPPARPPAHPPAHPPHRRPDDYRVIRAAVQQGAKYFGMTNPTTGVGGGAVDVGRAGRCTPGVDCPDPGLEVVCEHVGWHASLRSHNPDFKLYINPRCIGVAIAMHDSSTHELIPPDPRLGHWSHISLFDEILPRMSQLYATPARAV